LRHNDSRPVGGLRAIVVSSTVLGAAVLGAGNANADGPVQLRSRLGDACVDAAGGNWLNPPVINPCNGSDAQRWNVNADGRLESVAFPGQCLNGGDTARVGIAACWGSRRWNIQPDGRITAVLSGCLTVLGGTNPGTWLGTRFCNGSPEQGWDSVP
ncbi:hypothetical protein MRAB57_3316, partial [Mycobacterium rhizamassiliense]